MTFLRSMMVVLAGSSLLLASGCKSSEDGDGSGGTTGGGAGGEASGGGAGEGGTASGGGGAGGAAGGTGGGGGAGGAVDPVTDAFCTDYEDACGFGGTGRFADYDQCVIGFETVIANTDCAREHLDYVLNDGMPADTHCPHAGGDAPCDQ